MHRPLFILLLGSSLASAFPYGVGGTTSGRANSLTAEPDNAFAALYNPAVLAVPKEAQFEFGINTGSISFGSFTNIRVDSPQFRTESGEDRVEDFQIPDHSVTSWAVGFAYPFSLPKYLDRRAGFGVAITAPFGTVRSYESRTAYDFTTLGYGGWDNQLRAALGFSSEVLKDTLYLGVGMFIYFPTSGSVDVVIDDQNPAGRTQMEVGLNSALTAGIHTNVDKTRTSLVYHQEVNPEFTQRVIARPTVFKGEPEFQIPLLLQSSLYYLPHRFEFDTQRTIGSVKVSAGGSYELWSSYRPSYLTVQTTTVESQTVSTQAPPMVLKDTFNPRASVVVPIIRDSLSVGAGYQYRPSRVEDLSGHGNLIDTDTHILGLNALRFTP